MIINALSNSNNTITVNPNLFDNWYFVGGGSQQGNGCFPINTNGLTAYVNGAPQSIDRWLLGNQGHIVINSDGITWNKGNDAWIMGQVLNFQSITEPITVSVLHANGLNSVVFPNGTSENTNKTDGSIKAWAADSIMYLGLSVSSLKVYAVKLEVGTEQTLAHQENGVWILNELPVYMEQLTRSNIVRQYNFGSLGENKTVAFDALTIYATRSMEVDITATQPSGGSYTITITPPTGFTIVHGGTAASSLTLTPTAGKTIEISAKTVGPYLISVLSNEV